METLSSAWHHQHPGQVLTKYTLMPNVAWQAFEEVFSNRELLQTGFRIAGIFPWNRMAVHWQKLTAGTLYAKETPQGEALDVTDEVAEVIDGTEMVAEVMDSTEMVAEAMNGTEAMAEVINGAEVVAEIMNGTEEMAEVINGAEVLAEVMNGTEAVAEVMDRAPAVYDAHGSVRPLPQDDGTGERDYWQDHQLTGLLGPVGVANSRQTPEVSVPSAQEEDQVNIVATGEDILNFVPESGTNLVDIFPESNHEEKLHLLQR